MAELTSICTAMERVFLNIGDYQLPVLAFHIPEGTTSFTSTSSTTETYVNLNAPIETYAGAFVLGNTAYSTSWPEELVKETRTLTVDSLILKWEYSRWNPKFRLLSDTHTIFRTSGLSGYAEYECEPAYLICLGTDYTKVAFVSTSGNIAGTYGYAENPGITAFGSMAPGFTLQPIASHLGSTYTVTIEGSLDLSSYISTGPTPGGDPYGPGGNTGDDETDPTGGNGDFDNESDEIPIPLPPTTGAVDSGFITLYNPSMSQIQDLGSFMWSDLFDLDTFKKIFNDPMQAILGLSVVPVVPPRGSSVNVKIGNIQSGVFMTQVSSQFMQKDFGQITLNEYWGGYLDYSPYTQVEIYLPFIGVRPLSTDDVMGKTLHLVYNIDLLSGACMAFIAVNEDVLYQFIGQCACSVPITGNDWTNVINGVLNIAGAIGTTIATGGLSAPQAVGAVTSVASSVVSSKPKVEKSGSLSGMGGMLGVFSPYLIITRPRQALPASQNAFQGYPAFITRTLGTVSGFTRVADVHLDNITCTDAEKQEIKTLLEQGVIL